MSSGLSVLVLASPTGSVGDAPRPSPLDPLCGRPLLLHTLEALDDLAVDRVCVVVGQGAETVAKRLAAVAWDRRLECVEQTTRRGTADAVAVGLASLADDGMLGDEGDAAVLVVPGDRPLLDGPTLSGLCRQHRASGAAVTLLTAPEPVPGAKRVVRDRDGRIVRLVPDRAGDEFSTGIAVYRRDLLSPAVRRVAPRHGFVETDLDDVVAVLAETGLKVDGRTVVDVTPLTEATDQQAMAVIEARVRRRINDDLMARGVVMVDPDHTYIDASVTVAEGVRLLPGCILEGTTVIGRGAVLGPDVHLVDCAVGDGAVVHTTTGTDAEIGPDAEVGPYAVLAAGAQIAAATVTGPFYAAKSSDS